MVGLAALSLAGDDHRSAGRGRAVVGFRFVRGGSVGCDDVAEDRRLVSDLAVDRAGVRVEQQFRRVAPQPVVGFHGPDTRKP